jgi:hypothetical protein
VWESRNEVYRRHFMRIYLVAFKVHVVVLPCLHCSALSLGSNICLGLLDGENEGTVMLQNVRNYSPSVTASHHVTCDWEPSQHSHDERVAFIKFCSCLILQREPQ